MSSIDPEAVPDTLDGADLAQIQALLFRGWARKFRWSSFLFVEVPDDPDAARAWLRDVRGDIAWAGGPGPEQLAVAGGQVPGRLQVAFTTKGLRKLGLDPQIVQRFPFEAKAGMERRARVLGDPVDDQRAADDLESLEQFETNKPTPTDWKDQTRGGIDLSACDAMLLLYATTRKDRQAIDLAQRALIKRFRGRPMASELSSRWLEREPFGFADGVSQPAIKGQPDATTVPPSVNNTIAAGELLLGYRNEYGQVPKSPQFDVGHPKHGGFDVGKNGTFLVFRKLEQDVIGFWRTFAKLGKRFAGQRVAEGHSVPTDPAAAAHWLAARAMGRWTNGNSTMSCPFAPGEQRLPPEQINAFTYGADPHGLACPIGSHVRRANPRDQRGGPESESWKVVRRHRILRRGRAYGRLFDPDQLLRKLLAEDTITDDAIAAHAAIASEPEAGDEASAEAGDDDQTRSGLLFVCLQASITHGFEFVQQIWNNNPGFHGVFQEPDLVAGPGGSRFSIPAEPVRLRLDNPSPVPAAPDQDEDERLGMPRFVIPRGGGYFFVPSRATIDLLVDG